MTNSCRCKSGLDLPAHNAVLMFGLTFATASFSCSCKVWKVPKQSQLSLFTDIERNHTCSECSIKIIQLLKSLQGNAPHCFVIFSLLSSELLQFKTNTNWHISPNGKFEIKTVCHWPRNYLTVHSSFTLFLSKLNLETTGTNCRLLCTDGIHTSQSLDNAMLHHTMSVSNCNWYFLNFRSLKDLSE